MAVSAMALRGWFPFHLNAWTLHGVRTGDMKSLTFSMNVRNLYAHDSFEWCATKGSRNDWSG